MTTSMRQPTLETLGLGTVLEIFRRGSLPATAGELVDEVFGNANDRGSMVISGANGIVGAGKTIQLGRHLEPYGVPVVALDFPGAPDGIGKHYKGLQKNFGAEKAAKIMQGVIKLSYDGKNLPTGLCGFKPRFLLEAIPEILDVKKTHYTLFRKSFPEIEIRSVTSGFPSSELGVGIAHPAFPHNINKVWEVVEPKPSAATKLFWALGLIPIPVGDNWSFVLDVLFCGVTLAALNAHAATNMPYWKLDKYVRKIVGPNPFRAHDAIGAKGSDFLTWSCLHHLEMKYGELFRPTPDLDERKETGQEWYPPDHLRPLVDWPLTDVEETELKTRILGPLLEMTALMLHEKRAPLAHMNSIGELCAQFRKGIIATIRSLGPEGAQKVIADYRKLSKIPDTSPHAAVFDKIETPEWQQLYVNAEHDGEVGVITINRESYNSDVDAELNRAIDWLKSAKIESVIISGDFHIQTQMIGADTAEFFSALKDRNAGYNISAGWSKTARRLNSEFKTSVGFINGKRCLGGFLELLTHCHYVVATDSSDLGMPEVTLPVIPGMEGCHWSYRKADPKDWPKLTRLLLDGKSVKAKDAVGWLIDYSGSTDDAIKTAWSIAKGADHKIKARRLDDSALKNAPGDISNLSESDNPAIKSGRSAILDCIRASCGATLAEAIAVQAKHSAEFMTSTPCLKGKIGQEYKKTAGDV